MSSYAARGRVTTTCAMIARQVRHERLAKRDPEVVAMPDLRPGDIDVDCDLYIGAREMSPDSEWVAHAGYTFLGPERGMRTFLSETLTLALIARCE